MKLTARSRSHGGFGNYGTARMFPVHSSVEEAVYGMAMRPSSLETFGLSATG